MVGYFPGVALILLQEHTRFAIFLRQHRNARWHAMYRAMFQRSLHAVEGRKFTQLVNGGEDQRKLVALKTRQGLRWRNPDAFAGLQVIMRGLLFSRSSRNEEVRIETLRHPLRRDPVREIAQAVRRQHQPFSARHLFQRTRAILKRVTIALKMRYLLLWNGQYLSIAIGKQHARLLEKLADGGSSHPRTPGRAPLWIGWRRNN